MNQELKKLISLQEIDNQIYDIESLAGDLPNRVKNKEDSIDRFQSELGVINEKLNELEKQNRILGANIDDGQVKLNKYQEQLFLVKSNKEYDALNHEIDHIRTLLSESEEKLLMGETDIEKEQEAKKINISEIDELAKTLEGDKDNLKNALENSRDELEKLNKTRVNIIDEMRGEFLSQYNQLKKARGAGVSPLEENCCGSCFSTLPPQMIIEVRANTQIHTCPSCSVFMYWQEEILEE